jgi:hypothetical protein
MAGRDLGHQKHHPSAGGITARGGTRAPPPCCIPAPASATSCSGTQEAMSSLQLLFRSIVPPQSCTQQDAESRVVHAHMPSTRSLRHFNMKHWHISLRHLIMPSNMRKNKR